jgi:phage shock protein C
MYCTKCGVELGEQDRFCPRCGQPTPAGMAGGVGPHHSTLLLDKKNKKIAGVCAGFARYFGIDIVLMRVIWLGLALCTGVGFIAYLAAWIIVPSDSGYPAPSIATQLPQAGIPS